MFAKFDEIPSLNVQDIKEKPKRRGQTDFRITKGNQTLIELAPSPYFSIINLHLVDINVFTKFDGIPSLPVQDIKEKPKCCRWTEQYATPPPPPLTNTVCSGGRGIKIFCSSQQMNVSFTEKCFPIS